MLSQKEEFEEREEAIINVKGNTPDWFAAVFGFMMKDLNRISTVSMEVDTYKAQCETNSKEIKELCQKVDTLEKRNVELEGNRNVQ